MSAALTPTVDEVVGHTEHGGGRRTRVGVILAALVVGTLASVALGLWHPTPDANDRFGYDEVAGMRDAWWAWHLFGSIGTAVSAIAGSLVVVLLAPRRGAAWATAGAVAASLGALAFVTGASAEGVLYADATDPDALPVEAGRSFIDFVNDEPARVIAVIDPGMIVMSLGALLVAAALRRARTVPRWLPVAFAVTNLAGFVAPFGAPTAIAGIAFGAVLLAIGWQLWRQVSPAPDCPIPTI